MESSLIIFYLLLTFAYSVYLLYLKAIFYFSSDSVKVFSRTEEICDFEFCLRWIYDRNSLSLEEDFCTDESDLNKDLSLLDSAVILKSLLILS